jgi:hypothetical protein
MPRIPCPSEAWDRYYADMDASEVADINYGVLQRVYELSRNHGGRRRGPGREVNWTGKDSDLYPEGEWWVADVNVSAEDTMVVTDGTSASSSNARSCWSQTSGTCPTTR